MDIMYLVGQYPKISESFVINEIHELNERGHNIAVFAFQKSDLDISHKETRELDIPIYYADAPSIELLPRFLSRDIFNMNVLKHAMFIADLFHHAYWLYTGKQISESIDDFGGVDLIHAHFAKPNRIAAIYASSQKDIPCTVTAHAHEIYDPDSVQQLNHICESFDHIVVPSEYNRRYLRNEMKVKTPISVVPATTDVDKFKPSNNCIPGRLLTIARLVEKKGHKFAIEAVEELIERGYDVEYHIIGSGEYEGFLRERVQNHGLEDHITFLGNVSDERLLEELHKASVFVLPCIVTDTGDRDITPVALREAMATETACVSTTISAIPEVITDGHDGILVEPNSSTAVAEAIAKLLDNPGWREQLARNARETIKTEYDITIAVNTLESVFKSVK